MGYECECIDIVYYLFYYQNKQVFVCVCGQ